MVLPLKRHTALVAFSTDHHLGLLLGWKIRQGIKKDIPVSRMLRYLLAFARKDLIPHFEREEKELFVLLPVTDVLGMKAWQDHKIILEFLEQLSLGDSAQDELLRFTQMLDDHIRFEERQLFPHIERQQSFELYAAAMMAHGVAGQPGFDSTWDDPFWL